MRRCRAFCSRMRQHALSGVPTAIIPHMCLASAAFLSHTRPQPVYLSRGATSRSVVLLLAHAGGLPSPRLSTGAERAAQAPAKFTLYREKELPICASQVR
jgi:hypothetical protein